MKTTHLSTVMVSSFCKDIYIQIKVVETEELAVTVGLISRNLGSNTIIFNANG